MLDMVFTGHHILKSRRLRAERDSKEWILSYGNQLFHIHRCTSLNPIEAECDRLSVKFTMEVTIPESRMLVFGLLLLSPALRDP